MSFCVLSSDKTASNYYRTAAFYLTVHPSDPRLRALSQRSRSCFQQALASFQTPVEQVAIPYEGTTLPGYFYRVDDTPRPTLIILGGLDSTGEELYFAGAAAALQHGYHCLTFEGPGQGSVIGEQHLPFRPDWEAVVTPVVDYALSRSHVDPQRLALMGISWGGYLAPRAAAFEHRLAACVLLSGTTSPQDILLAMVPEQTRHLLERGDAAQFNRECGRALEQSLGRSWFLHQCLSTFRASSFFDLFQMSAQYTLERLVEQIRCPTLLCLGEADQQFAAQSHALYEALVCPKTFQPFLSEEGAEEHCQEGALLLLNQRVFQWLDTAMKGAER